VLTLSLLSAALGCSGPEPGTVPAPAVPATVRPNPLRSAYFGDLHIHTKYSLDAYVVGTRATPDDAYRFARGEAIDHPTGYKIQLEGGPLDFAAVTDHAVFLGILPAMDDPEQEISKLPLARELSAPRTPDERAAIFRELPGLVTSEDLPPGILDLDIVRSAWQEIVASAERNNEPGKLTTFVGYEYTSGIGSGNLHRNVIFRGSRVPAIPFSLLDSRNPEDLWQWLDVHRADGIESLAIPHNSNLSNGQKFRLQTFGGEPIDADYADRRMRNEPVVEVTQVKGTSETHPVLSPNDEWADFELFARGELEGSYVREAYRNGLLLEKAQGFNPYRFGLIGSSDTHTGGGPIEEDGYVGKLGAIDGTPERRGSVPLETPRPDGGRYGGGNYVEWGASGLAGVWAEENTRESIYDALRRKETFATSGPRIRVRFFAGSYPDGLESDPEMIATAYARGVPMGGDLAWRSEGSPRFLVWAIRDPNGAPLQRLQVIKGWIEDGKSKERVFDVSCSDGLEPDPDIHRCPDNGATVNLADCSLTPDRGAGELKTLWVDPRFDPRQRAFYYLRVLENPTCRWSTWDAVRAGAAPREDLPAIIQERAWSSPVWFLPAASVPGGTK
jgi:hypothetical protein